MNHHLLTRIFNVVMQSQKQLVDIVGKFTPKIVKMDGAKHKSWGKKRDEVVGDVARDLL
jgi:tRNA-splicing ligase RtcB